MLTSIHERFNSYVGQLPTNIPQAALTSSAYSFAITILLSSNIETGLAVAAIAGTVSVVSGLTMPVFRYLFANNEGNIKWYQYAATQVINLGITQLLVNSLTAYRLNLVASAFFTITLRLAFHGFSDYPTSVSPVYFFV
jgi:hypothetical protein